MSVVIKIQMIISKTFLVNPYTIQNSHPWQTNFLFFLDKTNIFLKLFSFCVFEREINAINERESKTMLPRLVDFYF